MIPQPGEAEPPHLAQENLRSAGLEMPLGMAMGDVDWTEVRVRKGAFTEIASRTVSGPRGDCGSDD